MKKRSSNTVLSFLVGLSALASVGLCLAQVHYTRQLRTAQAQLVQVNKNQNLMRNLVNVDLAVYAETNASIRPLLNSLRPKSNQP